MAGISHNCNAQNPCRICGKTDWCNFVEFPSGDKLAYCQRVTGAEGDVGSFSDGLYRLKRITDSGFSVWEPLSQYEANCEAWLKENGKHGRAYKAGVRTETQPKKIINKGVVEPLPPHELDRFYRGFLDLLILEDKHKKILDSEWGKVPGLTQRILLQYPIRSLPPSDYLRYGSKEPLRNKWRKRIMATLVETLGEPRGVRGFYRREGGAWDIACKGGILYPEMDENGFIVGLRYADDYPECQLLEGDEVVGKYTYEKPHGAEEAGWYLTTPDGEKRCVWRYGNKANEISLNAKWYPPGTKIRGKYKGVSSHWMEKAEESETEIIYVNRYDQGTLHITRPSLYTKEGDDPSVVYVTEGEKKAMVTNMLLNAPAISIPGVNSIGSLFSGMELLSSLEDRGMKVIAICLDADKASNSAVLKAEEKGVLAALAHGYNIAVGEWNPNWGKGLDDTLLIGVKPKIYPVR